MKNKYYEMIFKRKSFHMYREVIPLSKEELQEINNEIQNIIPLHKHIKTNIKLVHKSKTSCKRGEYCILIYSETKDGFLQNAGYIGEQLDLYLASKDIGVCWYGLAKPDNQKDEENLEFVIMLAIGKTSPKYFRTGYKKLDNIDDIDNLAYKIKCTRRNISDIYNEKGDKNLIEVVKYAPSACNSQPWFIENKDNEINLYRTCGKKSIVPSDKMAVINRVDIGIMILFIEIYLTKNNIAYTKEIFKDEATENEKALKKDNKILNAKYILK